MIKKAFLAVLLIFSVFFVYAEKLVDINVLDNDTEIVVEMEFDKIPVFRTEEDLSKTVFSIILPNLKLSYMYMPVHLGPLESVRFIDLEKETYITFYTLLPIKPTVVTTRKAVYVKFRKIPKKVNLSFEPGMALSEAIKYLSEYININVVISNEVANLSVPSIKLHNVSPEDAFRVVLISVPSVAYSYFPDGTLYVGKAGGDITEKFNKFWGIYKVPQTTSALPSMRMGEVQQNVEQTVQKSVEYFSEIYPGAVVEYLKRKSIILVYGGPAIHSKIVELLSGKRGYEVVKVKNPIEASRVLSEMFEASVTYLKPDKVVLKGDLATISKMKDVLNKLDLVGVAATKVNYETVVVNIPKENLQRFKEALKETEDFVKRTTGAKDLSIVFYPSISRATILSESTKAISSAKAIIEKLKKAYETLEGERSTVEVPEPKVKEKVEEKENKEMKEFFSESLDIEMKIDSSVLDEIRDYVSKDEDATINTYYYPDIGKLYIESDKLSAIEKVKKILNAYITKLEEEMETAESTSSLLPSTQTNLATTSVLESTSLVSETKITELKIKGLSQSTMTTLDIKGEFDYDGYGEFISKLFPELKVFPLKIAKKIIFIGDRQYIDKAIGISEFFKKSEYSVQIIQYPSMLPIEKIIENTKNRYPDLKAIIISSRNIIIASGNKDDIEALKAVIKELEKQLSNLPSLQTMETPEATQVKKVVTQINGKLFINAPGLPLGDVIKEVFNAVGESIIFVDYPEETTYLNVSGTTFDAFLKIIDLYGYTLKPFYGSYILERKTTGEKEEKPEEKVVKKGNFLVFSISHNFEKIKEFVQYLGGKIFIDEISGLAIVSGIEDQDTLKMLSSYIGKLSITPKQIEIEVKLVDEILSKNNTVTTTTNLGFPMPGGNVSISPNGLSLTTDILSASQYEQYLKNLLGANVSATYSPGQSSENSKVLAAPRVITTSGEKANIFIGDKEIYVLPSGTPLTQNYGVQLTISPTYRPDGTIELDINIKVSNSAPQTNQGQGQTPLASERSREANTRVIIKDGQTIVIGGLMREISVNSENKLPFLGDLPIIGALFRTTNETTEKRNLTIFITAKVVKGW